MLFGAASVPVGQSQQRERERERAGFVVDCFDYCYKSLINSSHFDGQCRPDWTRKHFEGTGTHLMLDDPIDKKVKSKRPPGGASISSALLERGCTGVNLCWYNRDEFKQLTQEQTDELIEWQGPDAGKAVIKVNKKSIKSGTTC